MFNNKRYATRGVNAEIPLILQLACWSLITNLSRTEKLDYLQVFKLSNENGKQVIEHKQEQPEYSHKYIFKGIETPVNIKLYVIDGGNHSTLMLAEEY